MATARWMARSGESALVRLMELRSRRWKRIVFKSSLWIVLSQREFYSIIRFLLRLFPLFTTCSFIAYTMETARCSMFNVNRRNAFLRNPNSCRKRKKLSRQNYSESKPFAFCARVEILISPDRRLNVARPPHEAEKNTKLWNLINQNHLGSGSLSSKRGDGNTNTRVAR